MAVVALAAVLMVFGRPSWRFWFASPIRTIVYQFPGQARPTTVTFDVRHPASAVELDRIRSQFDAAEFDYRIERSPVLPQDRFGSPSPRAAR